MDTAKKLEHLLEIYLITFNRAVSLDNTLNQLKDSPFSKCRLTVLDNCSTDETPAVTAKYACSFANYRVIRHPRNIGGDYNYLRGIELSSSVFTWILCDDDNYDFTDAADVIAAIESCRYDLIYVSSRSSVDLGWDGCGEIRAKQLVAEGGRFHRACAFWPSLIFRPQPEWYDTNCFGNAPYMFPSFRFLNKAIEHNYLIYVVEHPIVIRSVQAAIEHSPLAQYKEWVANAALITDNKLKEQVVGQWTDQGFFKTLAFWISLDKANRNKGRWKRLVDIAFALPPIQRLKFMLLLPVMVIPFPKSLLVRLRQIVYLLMGHNDPNKLAPVDPVGREKW